MKLYILLLICVGLNCVHGTGITIPSFSAADYPLVFKSPSNCDVSDCTVYVGVERNEGNSSFLNFYIEGDAAAWVAVGFSTTPNMPNADVLACNRISGGEEVEVLDTWNPGYSNVVDDDQDTIMFNSSVENGRIFCSFVRSITGTGDNQDLDLDGEYYVLFGGSDGITSSGFLVSHRTNSPPSSPSISGRQFNIAEDSGVSGEGSFARIRRALVRAHGIFMLIAWLLLVNIGTHFAWYMRLPLPNGEWFQVHRAVMIAALFISVIGFIFVFVSQAQRSPPGLLDFSDGVKRAHLIIGVMVVFLQILNPILAIFRCHPGEKYRWIFDVFHGKIFGFWAQELAISNIGIGLTLFSVEYSKFGDLTLLWIFLVYVGLSLIMHVILIILTIVIGRKYCTSCKCQKSACKCAGKSEGGVEMNVEMETVSAAKKDETEEEAGDAQVGCEAEVPDDQKEEKMPEAGGGHGKVERKEPAEGSLYIWVVMGVNMAAFAFFSLAFVVLIALV